MTFFKVIFHRPRPLGKYVEEKGRCPDVIFQTIMINHRIKKFNDKLIFSFILFLNLTFQMQNPRTHTNALHSV